MAESHRVSQPCFTVLYDGSPYGDLASDNPRIYKGVVSIVGGVVQGTQATDANGSVPTLVHVGDTDPKFWGCYYYENMLIGGVYTIVAHIDGEEVILHPYWMVPFGGPFVGDVFVNETPDGVEDTFTWDDLIPYGHESYNYGVQAVINGQVIGPDEITVSRTSTGGQVVFAMTHSFHGFSVPQTGDKVWVRVPFLPGE